MQVQDVLFFIVQLKSFKIIENFDTQFIEALSTAFKDRKEEDTLSKQDMGFLLHCYEERWRFIEGSKHSYLVSSTEINRVWIQFANKLSEFIDKKYYQILFPSITNTKDFNDFSLLSETKNPAYFYVSPDGKILYRKISLCLFLIKNGFYLQTSRGLAKNEPLAVSEFAQLKQQQSEFSIDEMKFDNFWDFLNKKAFPHLQDKKGDSYKFLSQLGRLIQYYFHLKKVQGNFSLFRDEAQTFFFHLQKSPLNEVNYFYGLKYEYKGTKYMLDFLVSIHCAQDFDLDAELNVLDPSNSVHPCYPLILSFLTLRFEPSLFFKPKISLWDKENVVTAEIKEIYDEYFRKPLIHGSKGLLEARYDQVIHHYFSKKSAPWYTLVREKKLSELGITWFEPALLLKVLMDIPLDHLRSTINQFNEELLHTYAQKENDLLKRVRVNILFIDMIRHFAPEDKFTVLRSLHYQPIPSFSSAYKEYQNKCSPEDKLSFYANKPIYTMEELQKAEDDAYIPDYYLASTI